MNDILKTYSKIVFLFVFLRLQWTNKGHIVAILKVFGSHSKIPQQGEAVLLYVFTIAFAVSLLSISPVEPRCVLFLPFIMFIRYSGSND